jgi:hypothetical protein
MHTSEQTIRDLINAVFFLAPQGVVVIDDVFPSSYLASLPDVDEFLKMHKASGEKSGAWMGDVFKLVFFIETFCQQFSFGTINNNHGQLVVWRKPRERVPERTLSKVAQKTYKDVYLEKKSFRFAPLDQILDRLKSARA